MRQMPEAARDGGRVADHIEQPHPSFFAERSGVLNPENLPRYGAQRYPASPALAHVVEHFWSVSWSFRPGISYDQRILQSPCINITIEEDAQGRRFMVTGLYRRAWLRALSGKGSAFGIRFRPAGFRLLTGLNPRDFLDTTLPVPARAPAALHSVLERIAAEGRVEQRALIADAELAAIAPEPDRDALLANAIVDELVANLRLRTGPGLAERFGINERTVQRVLNRTVGRGPKWISRWTRLQEVVRTLSFAPNYDMATLAAELGYADQAHLIKDFRLAVGQTPGAYLRSIGVSSQLPMA